MKAYEGILNGECHYIDNNAGKTLDVLFDELKSSGVKTLRLTEILDHKLEYRLSRLSDENDIKLIIDGHPSFLTEESLIHEFFKSRRFNMTSFYIMQRKRLKVLLEDGKAAGGKWSYDPSNRKKIPDELDIPLPWGPSVNEFVEEAIKYVEKRFTSNPGSVEDYSYPVKHDDAMKGLEDFIENRLLYFGDYQDAITTRSQAVFHSLLSSSLNTGLITPQTILKKGLDVYYKGDVSLNNVEGFIRQLIGWREYIRAVYILKGKQMINSNYLNHSKNLPRSFYGASTGLPPLDDVLQKVNRTAYAHHIERLMIVGNHALLTMINPKQVFNWFMEMFIDSYEWVMIPNVMAMSQYADNSITTKPYVSSSSYIRRMSNYPKGKWMEIWDALFWNFIITHREILEIIPRMKMIYYNLDRMPDDKKANHIEKANHFLAQM
jgi:deoxyribodipyrimidine photolyase-related protein